MILRGDKCQCRACGKYFRSTHAFDKHRTGDYETGRRCRTTQEMEAKGMAEVNGWWVGSRRVMEAA